MTHRIEAGHPLHLAKPGTHRFRLVSGARNIPVVAWVPEGELQGIILACHGGSGHKESPAILAISQEFLPLGYVVVAIDGPVHGERRMDGVLDPDIAKKEFRIAWRAGLDHLELAQDYISVLDTLKQVSELAVLPVGYIGVSMGTAYGIPLLAIEPRIQAAAIGYGPALILQVLICLSWPGKFVVLFGLRSSGMTRPSIAQARTSFLTRLVPWISG